MRINTNISAMNTYSRLTSANSAKSSSLAKLSSGLRINKAGDDAAGLAISEKMKNQISGMTQASRNAQDGISLIQTAEGALSETHNMLNRMRDLTVQASNDTNTREDRAAIQKEITSLSDEITRVAETTTFNTKGLMDAEATTTPAAEDSTLTGKLTDSTDVAKLVNAYNDVVADDLAVEANAETVVTALKTLGKDEVNNILKSYNKTASSEDAQFTVEEFKGSATPGTKEFTFQIGANSEENISVELGNMTAEGLKINNINVNPDTIIRGDNEDTADINEDTFGAMLDTIDEAIKTVSDQRAELGATQNRLDHTVSNLATTKENLSEANSRIVDVDMAEEMMSFTKNNILSQAATSMLAQANQMPQGVLSLLQ